MSQTRKSSLIETVASIAIGFVVSLVLTAWLMPLLGHHVTGAQNVLITCVFTVASLVRGYFVRRLFNLANVRKLLES